MNYAHGYPRFCVSIGVERRGEDGTRSTQVGVVYDPLLDELFCAVRGEGAQRNGDRPMRVSGEHRDRPKSLLATGFAYDRRTAASDDNVDHFASLREEGPRALRRDGSAALDLCYVAAGRFEGFWEFKLSPWDVAAGGLIVREAGGRVSDMTGGETWRGGRQVVASNGAIHDDMLAVLAETQL